MSAPEPRIFTLEMPAGIRLLSLNDRDHWSKRAAVTRDLRSRAGWLARAAHIPSLARASIVVEYQPPQASRRHRDPDNTATLSGKPCIDGLVDARVLPGDDSRYVTEVAYRIGNPFPKGRLVLHVTEVPPDTAVPAEAGEGHHAGTAVTTTQQGGGR